MINIPTVLEDRSDLLQMVDQIKDNSRVLDLGCGDGSLLKYLKKTKKAKCLGVEISQSKIIECVKNGVPVIKNDLNKGLKQFKDQSFDVAILGQTLQAVQRPDKLLKEMTRISKISIISFLNIGYYRDRFQFFFSGKMPVTKELPYSWYDTSNIHLSTIKDFKNLCNQERLTIKKEIHIGGILSNIMPNLFAPTSVFVISE